MKHLLILLISILLLSSFLTSCEKKNGPGTETFEDGSSYVGVFEDGERNGQGTYNYSDGDKYEGEWRMGNIMVKVHTLLKMEVSMSGNGRMINTTVKVHGLEKGNGKDKNM